MARKITEAEREAVRVLAIEIGAREAARRKGYNEATVCAWSAKYKWRLPARNQHAVIATPFASLTGEKLPTAEQSRRKGDQLLADLKTCEAGTRSSLARATWRAAQEAEQLEHVLPRTQQLQQLGTAASRVFGWDIPQQHNTFNTLVVSSDQLEQIRQLRGA